MQKYDSKNSINVLHLVNYFNMGGLEKVIKELVLNSRNPINNSVCAITKKGPFAREVEEKGIQVFEIDPQIRKVKVGILDRLARLKQIFSECRIDIIHCHDMAAWHLATVSKLFGISCKIVFTKHGNFDLSNRKLMVHAFFFSKLTHRIVPVSEDIEQTLRYTVRIGKKRLNTIINGIDIHSIKKSLIPKTEARWRLNISSDAFVTGTVTRFYEVKNIEMQINMVEKLRGLIPQLLHVIVAPIGPVGRKYERQIKERRLNNHIQLFGFRDDIPEVLSSFDVFLLTSFTEGTSMALLEAIAAGCIPVVSRVGGNLKIISHGKNGFLFDVNDLDELCQCLEEIAKKPELSEKMWPTLKKTSECFGIDSMIEKYRNLYNRIMYE